MITSIFLLIGIGIDEKMLLKWKREWWTECCWIGSWSDEKNVAEMEAGLMKTLMLKWKRNWWTEYCWNECCWNGGIFYKI